MSTHRRLARLLGRLADRHRRAAQFLRDGDRESATRELEASATEIERFEFDEALDGVVEA